MSADTISSEIIKAAEECVIHLPEVSGATRWILRDLISRAINNARMAERERCARLVEEGYDRGIASARKHDMCAHSQYRWEDCDQCAAIAIRAAPKSEA